MLLFEKILFIAGVFSIEILLTLAIIEVIVLIAQSQQ